MYYGPDNFCSEVWDIQGFQLLNLAFFHKMVARSWSQLFI